MLHIAFTIQNYQLLLLIYTLGNPEKGKISITLNPDSIRLLCLRRLTRIPTPHNPSDSINPSC
jgi:hypothetical protein